MVGAYNSSYLGGWDRRITWTWEVEVAVSWDHAIGLQPGQQEQNCLQKNKKTWFQRLSCSREWQGLGPGSLSAAELTVIKVGKLCKLPWHRIVSWMCIAYFLAVRTTDGFSFYCTNNDYILENRGGELLTFPPPTQLMLSVDVSPSTWCI